MKASDIKIVRDIILAELATGTKTTEQLRVAICDTRMVLYGQLTRLRKLNLIESNNPKLKSIEKKWRLKANPTTPD